MSNRLQFMSNGSGASGAAATIVDLDSLTTVPGEVLINGNWFVINVSLDHLESLGDRLQFLSNGNGLDSATAETLQLYALQFGDLVSSGNPYLYSIVTNPSLSVGGTLDISNNGGGTIPEPSALSFLAASGLALLQRRRAGTPVVLATAVSGGCDP